MRASLATKVAVPPVSVEKGIWYGRVEPKHVEGIVQETISKGRVVEDMFRGGIDQHRKLLRI